MSAMGAEAELQARADEIPAAAGIFKLTRIELRKMTDTRSGFWLPIATAAISLLVAILTLTLRHGNFGTYSHVFANSTQPLVFLLPIMGVLLVCSEWSQHTTLITFVLTPRRWRVIAAKALACVFVSIAALVFCLIVTFVLTPIISKAPGGTGSLPLAMVGQGWVALCTRMLIGFAFGTAILASSPAVVVYLLLPTVWAALLAAIPGLDPIARWISTDQTLEPLLQHTLSATEWVHFATTVGLWVLVPLLIGAWRIRESDL
jgi:ABC-type transport system involved in multi-copper enzyme maturation permease subunit